LNGYVDDIGSPIDSIIQDSGATPTQIAAACSIMEPASGRYWLFLKDTIYVLSQYRSSKILAWSKYLATHSVAGVQTAFVPEKFVVYNGQVYARAGNALYLYGGADGVTYDNCVATVELPYLDLKTPSTRKMARGFDVAMTGAWTLSAGMDPVSGILDTVFSGTTNSFDKGAVPWSSEGTHIKLKLVTTGSTAAKVSSLVIKYTMGDEE